MLRAAILSTAALLILGGCGRQSASLSGEDYADAKNGAPAGSLDRNHVTRNVVLDDSVSFVTANEAKSATPSAVGEANQPQGGEQQPERIADTAATTAVERKIIYNASISLGVAKLESTRKEIKKLVAGAGGHIQQFTEQRNYGDRLSGRWVVRVPATKFDDFLAAVEDLGVPQSQHIETSEVTAEFYDIDARLRTKRQVEQEMLEIIKTGEKKVADLVEAQRQLGHVREEIEVMEGRLRQLSDLVALSTVTIEALEDEKYTPPQAPAFGDRIAQAFGSSIDSLLDAGQALVLAVVVLAPWLLALAIVVVLPLMLLIAAIRRRAVRPA